MIGFIYKAGNMDVYLLLLLLVVVLVVLVPT